MHQVQHRSNSTMLNNLLSLLGLACKLQQCMASHSPGACSGSMSGHDTNNVGGTIVWAVYAFVNQVAAGQTRQCLIPSVAWAIGEGTLWFHDVVDRFKAARICQMS